MSGVDLVGAALLIVEIGSVMEPFGSADRLVFWSGICPGNNESSDKRKSGRLRKDSAHIRRLFCEFARSASRTTPAFKAKFQALVIRCGYKRAIIALTHKLLRTIYYMLKRRKHYRDSVVDYEALSVKRNSARWLRALEKYGYLPS